MNMRRLDVIIPIFLQPMSTPLISARQRSNVKIRYEYRNAAKYIDICVLSVVCWWLFYFYVWTETKWPALVLRTEWFGPCVCAHQNQFPFGEKLKTIAICLSVAHACGSQRLSTKQLVVTSLEKPCTPYHKRTIVFHISFQSSCILFCCPAITILTRQLLQIIIDVARLQSPGSFRCELQSILTILLINHHHHYVD